MSQVGVSLTIDCWLNMIQLLVFSLVFGVLQLFLVFRVVVMWCGLQY